MLVLAFINISAHVGAWLGAMLLESRPVDAHLPGLFLSTEWLGRRVCNGRDDVIGSNGATIT